MVGCASRTALKKCETITLPNPPDAIALESKGVDKSKYPGTKWIKPPQTDVKKGRAYWSFQDVKTISDALQGWDGWYIDVKELIEGHNKDLETKGNK